MLLTSNCTAILPFFPKRPMKADFCHCVANEQMRTKWGNQANPGRVPGKSNKQRPQRHSRGILISSEVEQPPPPLLCMTSLIQSCLGMHCVCARVSFSMPTNSCFITSAFRPCGSKWTTVLPVIVCASPGSPSAGERNGRRGSKRHLTNCDDVSCTFGQSGRVSCLMRSNTFLILCNFRIDVAALSVKCGYRLDWMCMWIADEWKNKKHFINS